MSMSDLLPSSVVVETSEADADETVLFPEEVRALGASVQKRRAEFATVRDCARRALARLGVAPVPILPGPGREPLWPRGIVGSLTHCEGFRAAAVARAGDIVSLGIDAEPHAPLPGEVARLVTGGEEPRMLARLAASQPGVCWDRLLFSAKESIYKTWYPLMRTWLDFTECALDLRADGTFTGHLLVPGPTVARREVRSLDGRWELCGDRILTAVCLPVQGTRSLQGASEDSRVRRSGKGQVRQD